MIQISKIQTKKLISILLERIIIFLENSISSIENLQAKLRTFESKYIVIGISI